MNLQCVTNHETFDKCFHEHFSELTQIAHGLASKWLSVFDSLAEDIDHAAMMLVNEAYIEAISTLRPFDPEHQSFRSLFVAAMYHVLRRKQHSLAHRRWQQVAPSTLSLVEEEQPSERDPVDALLAITSTDPERHFVVREYIGWLLSFLSARDRSIVDLYFFQGVGGPEIARGLHWSLNQFHSHLSYICRYLRTLAQERRNDEAWSVRTLPGNSNAREKNCFSAF